MIEQQLLNLLGLAKRAGGLVTGNDTCMTTIRSRKAALTIVASDTGANAMKKYHDKCKSFEVPILVVPFDKERLGHAVGKAQSAIIVVTERGFAQRIRQLSGEQFGGERD
ncbi:MAG: L7Ae/L30e/S12e/Gadd45 family ribosomal protein [Tumebacillaceae bacterium]